MRKPSVITAIAALCLAGSLAGAQDPAAGRKTFEAKCASCHSDDARGKFLRAPSIKGKTVEKIQKKDHALKKLSPEDVKNVAAYLATLK